MPILLLAIVNANRVKNLQETARMIIFAPLLHRLPRQRAHNKLLGWWNGRHEGLKILWPLRLCGFKSRSEYLFKGRTVGKLAARPLAYLSPFPKRTTPTGT